MFRELHRMGVFLLGAAFAAAGLSVVAAHGASPRPMPPQFAEWLQIRSNPQVTLASDVVDGFTWSVITYQGVPNGQTCDDLKEPLPPGTLRQTSVLTYVIGGAGCIPTANVLSEGPIRQNHGWLNAGPAAGEYVWGYVSPRIQTLSVVLANCKTVNATTAHGVFLYVADDKSLTAGGTPVAVIGKDANGDKIATLKLQQLSAAVAQLPNLSGTAATSATTTSRC